MILYQKDDLEISIIDNSDKKAVLNLFSENDFNCDPETGALRPTNDQFLNIMDDIILGKNDESNIFVLKKNGKVIGYVSMFVEYDRLNIGHIAVEKSQRNNGYGCLLTNCAIMVAENEGREVSLYCLYPNSYLKSLDFKTSDGIHYLHVNQGIKTPALPKLFVSIEDYKKRQKDKSKKQIENFRKFLESDDLKKIWDL